MNREEIADKLINIARKEGYRYANMNTWYLFADFVLSEIDAAEKRGKVCPRCGKNVDGAHTCIPSPWLVRELKAARREVAEEIRDSTSPGCDNDYDCQGRGCMSCKIQRIIAANSEKGE